ncbi:RRP8 protein, partial [Amia calva]|nr:RRP8 protein [Amia calva]
MPYSLGHQKVGKPRVLGAGLGKGGNVIFPVPVEGEAGKEEGQCKLSRQQWRNKMKNKRKSKNKFCPNRETSPAKAEEKEGSESKEHSTTPSTTHPKVKSSKPKKGPETIGSKEKNETNKEELILVKKGSTSSRVAIKHGLKVKASDSQLAEDVINTLAQEDIRAKKRRQEVRRQQGRLQRLRRVLESDATLAARGSCAEEKREEGEEEKQEEVSPSQSVPGRSAALRARMELRLESARFRYINQQLYTSSSLEAQQLFCHDRQAFEIYHRGFTAQVQRWPSNPVDSIISYIHNKPASLVVADFGCGDCKIALSVRNKVHCFDLSPINNLVTVCDMANVPLQNDSVDIAVFCLSLMGTNISDFLVEANRVLVMR